MPKKTELGGGGIGWRGRELSSACCSLVSCSVTSLVRSVVAGWVGGRPFAWFDCWSVSTLVWTDWVGGRLSVWVGSGSSAGERGSV